ncbi:MAG: spore germination protein [Clostridia bacterium]|nr:spore germination protein [Clostridia bacterium]
MYGAIVLGDASVSANIVSPILVIIVAITGITAFAVPDFSLGFHVRIVRFAYIVSGYFAGFLGIAFCFVTHITILASINSFGVAYLSPYSPISKDNSSRILPSSFMEKRAKKKFLKYQKTY